MIKVAQPSIFAAKPSIYLNKIIFTVKLITHETQVKLSSS